VAAPKLNPGLPIRPDPPLNWGGRLLLGLIFAVGVALSIFGGLVTGLIVWAGLGEAEANQTPTKGVGLAPDLSGLVRGVEEFTGSTLVGAGLGLVVGVFVMWAACRFVVGPLMRRMPALTTKPTDAVT
jgi:hypothetical protein